MNRHDEIAEISLGGDKHKVEALTLDELQDIIPSLEAATAAATSTERIAAMRIVVAQALRMTPEALGKCRMDLVDLADALATILTVTGLEELGKRAAARKN